jgi:hypothetical protein
MKKELSPEGRLLALIKGMPKAPEPEKPVRSKPIKSMAAFLRSKKAHIGIRPERVPVLANRMLAVLFILLSLYLVSDILFMRPHFNIAASAPERPNKAAAINKVRQMNGSQPEVKDYSAYQAQMSGRTLFGQASVGQDKAKDITTSASMAELFALVGIIPGDNPKAIIEDKKEFKTYYLAKGESFNGFIVDEISDGSVKLVYEGKKIELFL